jgi:hypothetical protein
MKNVQAGKAVAGLFTHVFFQQIEGENLFGVM